MEIKDNTISRQFETLVNNSILAIEYSLQEKKLFLTKLTLPDNFINQTIVDDFITDILNLAEEKKFKVVPTSPKIANFFKRNPKFKELLPPGIRI